MTTFQTLEQLLGDTQSVNLGVLRTPAGLTLVLQGSLGIHKFKTSGAELDEGLSATLSKIVTDTRSETLLEQIRTAPLPSAKSAGSKVAAAPPAQNALPATLNHEDEDAEPDAEGAQDEHDAEYDLI